MVVVLSGYALATVFGNSTICDSFFKLLVQCKSVLCCRVTPKQKVSNNRKRNEEESFAFTLHSYLFVVMVVMVVIVIHRPILFQKSSISLS